MNRKATKGLGRWFPIIVLLVMVGAAAMTGIHAAGITNSRKTTQTNTVQPGIVGGSSGIVSQSSEQMTDELSGVLRQIDAKNHTITVYQMDRQEELTLSYTGTTEVLTRYGNPITMLQLELGEIIRTVCQLDDRSGTKVLVQVKEDDESWTYEGVRNLVVDKLDYVMTIGEHKYRYDGQLTVVDDGKLVELESLSEKDILTVRGIQGKIYSLEVTKGHGTLEFDHYTAFIGGSIEVGYEVFEQIHTGMSYVLQEGNYKLVMRNQDLAVNKYITITKGQTLTVDLNEYRNEVGKIGLVTFSISPEDAELYLDNELVDASVPVELGYGDYILEVVCEGYETCSRLLTVSMATQSIQIDLAENQTEAVDGSLSELPDSSEEEIGAGSQSGNDDFEPWEFGDEEDDIIEIDNEDTSDEIQEIEDDSTSTDSGNISSSSMGSQNKVITDHYIMVQKPEGVKVYFDGTYMGVAPLQMDKVTGEHQITLSQDGYISKTYTIDVENDGENPVFSFPSLTKE